MTQYMGGKPDEINVDARGDGDFNVDFFFRSDDLEYRLVLDAAQLRALYRDAIAELIEAGKVT